MPLHLRRPTARVVLFDADPGQGASQVLLVNHVHRDRPGPRDFWCFPGGGVEPGEGYVEAAVREMREETHLVIEPLGVGWIHDFVGREIIELFIWAIPVGGELRVGEDPERAGQPAVLTRAEWVRLDALDQQLVLPEQFAAELHDARDRLADWPLLSLPQPTQLWS